MQSDLSAVINIPMKLFVFNVAVVLMGRRDAHEFFRQFRKYDVPRLRLNHMGKVILQCHLKLICQVNDGEE